MNQTSSKPQVARGVRRGVSAPVTSASSKRRRRPASVERLDTHAVFGAVAIALLLLPHTRGARGHLARWCRVSGRSAAPSDDFREAGVGGRSR